MRLGNILNVQPPFIAGAYEDVIFIELCCEVGERLLGSTVQTHGSAIHCRIDRTVQDYITT